MTIETQMDLFEHGLRDAYAAEQMILEALDDLDETTTDEKVTRAFRDHRNETKGQIDRLERIFQELDKQVPRSHTCEGIRGILAEHTEVASGVTRPNLVDIVNLAFADRAEHYEISMYGNLAYLARDLGFEEAGDLLHESLEEEKAMLQNLKNLVEGYDHDEVA